MTTLRTRAGVAIGATAATYFYFLLFAEFAFLELVGGATGDAARVRATLTALGLAGVVGGVVAARGYAAVRAEAMLRWSMRACALGAVVAIAAARSRGPTLAIVAAVVSGGALGALTVTLAATLRGALGERRLGLGIGLGTGLAYAACNLPWVFRASPSSQAALAAAVVSVASLWPRGDAAPAIATPRSDTRFGLAGWIVVLLALVWLDSAGFYIIQHTPSLRAGTWSEPTELATNGLTHLAVAVMAGWMLDRGRRGVVLGLATMALAAAGMALNGSWRTAVPAGWLYTAGVSLYSVALVELPARTSRPWVAAAVFGVAGWAGSALGIGMAQDLAEIPNGFIGAAAALVFAVLAWRTRRGTRLALFVVAALATARGEDDVALGREVYIAEGCIHCHSQYIRARVAAEVLNWGPATPLRSTLAATPPLIGTRRQGPDLSHVGNRRSPEWNRLHLIAPQTVSPGSRMPSYAHLFQPGDPRGEALVAYLASLGADTLEQRHEQIATWSPATAAAIAPAKAAQLFGQLCAQCHGPSGRGDGQLTQHLNARPPDWTRDPWRHLRPGRDEEAALSRIIKFGLLGLPMAGHEYLPDDEIVGLARHVRMLHEPRIARVSADPPP